MFDKVKEKLVQGRQQRVVAFIILYVLIYSLNWAITEPLNLDITTKNKGLWRSILILGTLILTIAVYSYLLYNKSFQRWAKNHFRNWYLKPYRGYFAELRANFSEMPFIYQGINMPESLTIQNDHVAASYLYYPLLTHSAKQLEFYRESNSDDSLQDLLLYGANVMLGGCSRILLLGHAGMGKTTFIQHTILNIIDGKRDFYPFLDDRILIPIFVPLKILDHETISPILKYINTIPFFFGGDSGLKRLIRLASERRIVLFLDGYDEIKTNVRSRNTIVDELNILFSRESFHNPERNPLFRELYNLLAAYNSIWLTSRLSYFFESPLSLMTNQNDIRRNERFFENLTENKPQDFTGRSEVVGSILINGIQEKSKLISKLIDRYQKKHPDYTSLTPYDVFKFIETYFDDRSEEVTNSPLFLTIFFYIYVKTHYELNQSIDQKLTLKFAIELCTDLILNDLDRQKVRNLDYTGIHQRIEFDSDVKKEFIKFFSYQSYVNPFLNKKNSFTREDLLKIAHDFNTQKHDSNLLHTEKDKYKLVDEILRQNFFIMVTSMGDAKHFDFPHRRFKEFFTIDFFNTGQNLSFLFKHLRNPDFRDFIALYYLNSEANNEAVLLESMNQIINSGNLEGVYSLLNECLSYKKGNLSNLPFDALLKSLIFDIGVDSLSSELIAVYQLTSEFARVVESGIAEYIISDDSYNTKRVLNIYYSLDSKGMNGFVAQQIGKNSITRPISQMMCDWLIEVYPTDTTFEIFRRQFNNESFASLLDYLGSTPKFAEGPWLWKDLFKNLSTVQKPIFLNYMTDELRKDPYLSQTNKTFLTLLVAGFEKGNTFPLIQEIFKTNYFSELITFLNTLPQFTGDKDNWKYFAKYLNEEQLKMLKRNKEFHNVI